MVVASGLASPGGGGAGLPPSTLVDGVDSAIKQALGDAQQRATGEGGLVGGDGGGLGSAAAAVLGGHRA